MAERAAQKLAFAASAFKARRRAPRRLPALWFFTDPQRTPQPEGAVARLPRGAAVVFRGFGRPDAEALGRRLACLSRRHGLVFLVGADATLARRLRADGVHLPERLWRDARPARKKTWLVTIAAHDRKALARAGEMAVDAVVLSPVFPSASPSAGGRHLGVRQARLLARQSQIPVIALGGMNATTARRARTLPFAGLAAIDALKPPTT